MYLCAVIAPFVGSFFAGLFGRWLGARGSGVVTVFGLATSACLSAMIWHETAGGGCPVSLSLLGGSWFSAGTVSVNWFLQFDALTAGMLLTVTVVSFCVHIYSIGYMQADPHCPRFLSYLSLFTGSMLLLVTATDLVTLLVGWEMIGVSSYLLIGFWFHRLSATKSAQKAVLVNRVSDTLLIAGILTAWWFTGSTDLYVLAATATVSVYNDFICFFLLCGALGKSAQIGLHVWLADAMEGPTPVSALIHAATLVTAGIYLIARTSALWECSAICRNTLVFVGAVTSLMAATLGLVQNDMKRVIAYSTCSQLGYMAVSLGLSQYGLAIYHLMTHACFKALLFLGAGVVIHNTSDRQDLRRMGGAHSALPYAWALFLLGSLSLVGWPFLAGYYSKDAILELALSTPSFPSSYSFVILMAVAAMTSAYSFRVLVAVFQNPASAKRLEVCTPGVPYTITIPLSLLAFGSVFAGYMLSDALIGWGTPLWQQSMTYAPSTVFSVESHMAPVWTTFLPLCSVFLGILLATSYTWPLPFWSKGISRSIYLFLLSRWQFDYVFNTTIAAPVLSLGKNTWASIDKGVLEVLGPRGMTTSITKWAVPTVHRWQTGIVHDYALYILLSACIGIVFLIVPELYSSVENPFSGPFSSTIGSALDQHSIVLAILLLISVVSFCVTIEFSFYSLIE
jgi:proton-translocating NADH-quinone oxidoreductase chain L